MSEKLCPPSSDNVACTNSTKCRNSCKISQIEMQYDQLHMVMFNPTKFAQNPLSGFQ